MEDTANRTIALAFVLLCLFCQLALAQPAYLMEDINPGMGLQDLSPGGMVDVDGTLFLFCNDTLSGTELWKTDGTDAGTTLVIDMGAGPAGGRSGGATKFAGGVLFAVGRESGGFELWWSDGTYEGTYMVKDIDPGPGHPSMRPLGELNGKLYFRANDQVHGDELWSSDATEAGTVMVKDILPGPEGGFFWGIMAGEQLVFLADDGIHGRELWRSDGTGPGTLLVKDILQGPGGSHPGGFTAVNGLIFFEAMDGLGRALWRTDGTAAGTFKLKELLDHYMWRMAAAGGLLYFFLEDSATHEVELWISDGTESGTVGGLGTFFFPSGYNVTELGNAVLFSADEGVNGWGLWRSDGTASGTTLVKDIAPDYGFVGTLNGVAYFEAWDEVHGRELWRTDGTEAGTYLVKDVAAGEASVEILEPGEGSNDVLYYGMRVPRSDVQLWRTDGTEVGTHRVKELVLGWTSFAEELTDVGGTLFFRAWDGSGDRTLWRSDGTSAGTWEVKDVSWPGELTEMNGELFFVARDPETQYSVVWRSDGTAEGTVPVNRQFVRPHYLVESGGSLYFSAQDGGAGARGLCKSDGSEEGTYMVFDGIRPSNLTDADDLLFFTQGTRDVWVSDGTEQGTIPLVSDQIWPRQLTAVDGKLFFSAHFGHELWKSDGTVTGTSPVTDTPPGPFGLDYLTEVDGLLFFTAVDLLHNRELWRSDGTENGTYMVKDITVGVGGSRLSSFTDANGELYFRAYDQVHGYELWRSDGTEAGTVMVKDILPGPRGSMNPYLSQDIFPEQGTMDLPSPIIGLFGQVLFAASDGETGAELWRSDGTEVGTFMLDDIAVGPASSTPESFVLSGSDVFFRANDGVHGRELWALSVFTLLDEIQITGPIDPVAIGTDVSMSAIVPESITFDTAIWVWGDTSTSPGIVEANEVLGHHVYHTPGVYTVYLTLFEGGYEVAMGRYQFVVVFDPDGGFVTGGGWIDSPAGACPHDSALTGKANFGFVSKYEQGANAPTGETQFRFRVADLTFHSTSYEWLVIAGRKARFKGTGMLNDTGTYGFMLTGIDGDLAGGDGLDKFRIKIWYQADEDEVVYDNQLGDSDDQDLTTDLGGGSIVVHKEN